MPPRDTTQDEQIEIRQRQAVYRSVTDAIHKGDDLQLEQIIETAHRDNRLDEKIIRIGLQHSVRKTHAPTLQILIKWGETSEVLRQNDDLLRIALQEAARQGNYSIAKLLLEHGARTDAGAKGSNALWCSATHADTPGHIDVTKLLLTGHYAGCPPDKEWRDEDGRTTFVSAAEKGHFGIIKLLLEHGVNFNARDNNDRTIIHVLAATPEKKYRHNERCLELLLSYPIEIDRPDSTGRTALHWAASTGKAKLVEHLLNRPRHPRADPNCETNRGKTALHLACSDESPNLEIVSLLLKYGADTTKTSDGNWTCLHHAAQVKKSESVVREIIAHSPHLLNLPTSTGMTALHIAASTGCSDVVSCLLGYADTKMNARDSFHWTPLLRAAGNGHMDIVKRLAPFKNLNRLSSDAMQAARGFDATIVDFRAESQHHTIVRKYSVYDVLYGVESNGDPTVSTVVANVKARAGSSKPLFRWIHLPANNIAWVEALIVKHLVENESTDIDGFKDVERSFAQQHRGMKHHSQYMRPLCQTTSRSSETSEPTRHRTHTVDMEIHTAQPSPRGLRTAHSRRHKSDHKKRLVSLDSDDFATPADTSNNASQPGNNIVLFMPYLHYETVDGHMCQRAAIKRIDTTSRELGRQPSCDDEALIFGHLQSTTGLHLRRTLHQYYLEGVDTEDRDLEQVVGRYHRAHGTEARIFMVDQLWIWILGPELIISAFPRRWQQPKNDPLDVLDGVVQDVNSGMRGKRIVSPYELVAVITGRCCGVFDRHRADDETYRFLEIFEKCIGDVTYQEPTLYSNFYKASATVYNWFKNLESAEQKEVGEYSAARDFFLEFGRETALLQEIKDIREELRMISMVLGSQDSTLSALRLAISDEFAASKSQFDARRMERKFDEQKMLVSSNMNEIARMIDMVQELERSFLNLLDLKQKQSNAFEAKASAAQANRQNQITLTFTLVTTIFLPVSFMTSLFAIPINNFPETTYSSNGDGNPTLSLGYVAKYTFGIGLGISCLIILLAFNLDYLTVLFRRTKAANYRWLERRGWRKTQGADSHMTMLGPYRTNSGMHRPAISTPSFIDNLGAKEMEMQLRRSAELTGRDVTSRLRRRISGPLMQSPERYDTSLDLERG